MKCSNTSILVGIQEHNSNNINQYFIEVKSLCSEIAKIFFYQQVVIITK